MSEFLKWSGVRRVCRNLMRRGAIAFLSLVLAGGTGCGPVESLNLVTHGWPKKPITISCFAAAGGGTDAVSRILAKGMAEELGAKINVVNLHLAIEQFRALRRNVTFSGKHFWLERLVRVVSKKSLWFRCMDQGEQQ